MATSSILIPMTTELITLYTNGLTNYDEVRNNYSTLTAQTWSPKMVSEVDSVHNGQTHSSIRYSPLHGRTIEGPDFAVNCKGLIEQCIQNRSATSSACENAKLCVTTTPDFSMNCSSLSMVDKSPFIDSVLALDSSIMQVLCENNTNITATTNSSSHMIPPDIEITVLDIIMAVILISLIVCVIIGNLLVVSSVLLFRDMRTLTNALIVSLASADLMVAIMVLPLSLYFEISDRIWMLGPITCDFWITTDVFCCTASILNIVVIAMDRYWLITMNVRYTHNARFPRKRVCLVMVFLAWSLSAIISAAPLLGWTEGTEKLNPYDCLISQDYFYTIFSTFGAFWLPLAVILIAYFHIFRIARTRARKRAKSRASCSTINSTVFTEIAEKALGKEKTRNNSRSHSMSPPLSPLLSPKHHTTNGTELSREQTNGLLSPDTNNKNMSNGDTPNVHRNRNSRSLSFNLPYSALLSPNHVVKGPDLPSDHTNSHLSNGNQMAHCTLHEHSANEITNGKLGTDSRRIDLGNNENRLNGWHRNSILTNKDDKSMYINANNQLQHSKASHMDTFPSDSPPLSCDRICEESDIKENTKYDCEQYSDSKPHDINVTTGPLNQSEEALVDSPDANEDVLSLNDYHHNDEKIPHHHHHSDRIRSESRVSVTFKTQPKSSGRVVKEYFFGKRNKHFKKLTQTRSSRKRYRHRMRSSARTLGLIIGGFLLCWLPFFILATIMPFCAVCGERIPPIMFSVCLWLGYSNSLLNPAIYAIWDKNFRKSFKKVLKCSINWHLVFNY